MGSFFIKKYCFSFLLFCYRRAQTATVAMGEVVVSVFVFKRQLNKNKFCM